MALIYLSDRTGSNLNTNALIVEYWYTDPPEADATEKMLKGIRIIVTEVNMNGDGQIG
jgi:hypothetical protein